MPKKLPVSDSDPDRRIADAARHRIGDAIATVPVEKIQDLKILADIIDSCLKRADKTTVPDDPIAALLSIVRATDSSTGSPTGPGDSPAEEYTA
ncbi:MAG TPA: hypothetical protein PK765_00195 [bacterium]|nr:hypothetical protein [bacterium]